MTGIVEVLSLRMRRGWALVGLLAACAVLLGGCSGVRLRDAYAAHAAGDFDEAHELAMKYAPRPGKSPYQKRDEIWVALEVGKIAQDAGRFRDSIRALNAAEERLRAMDYLPEIRLAGAASEVGAVLTDETSRPYEPTFFDVVMLESTQAINYAMLGDLETAQVYARRLMERQAELTERRAALMQAFENYNDSVADEQSRGVRDLSDVQRLPEYLDAARILEDRAGGTTGDIVMPYGLYVGSVIMRAAGRESEAREFDRLLAAFAPGSAAAEDRAAAEAFGRGDETVYVLFENGLSPARVRDERRIGLVGEFVPLPWLEEQRRGRAGALHVMGGGDAATSELIGSMDAVVARDFLERLPLIWGRPILSTAIKITATEVGAAFASEWWQQMLIRAGGYLWAASAKPDLRIWRTLPGEQQVAQIERPASGQLTLTVLDGYGSPRGSVDLELPGRDGPVLLLARSTREGNLRVTATSLVDQGLVDVGPVADEAP